MTEIFKNFVIDRWYKMLLAISVAAFFISLTVTLPHGLWITNNALFFLSLGGAFVGMGEMSNGSIPAGFDPPAKWNLAGIVLWALGMASAALGAVLVCRAL